MITDINDGWDAEKDLDVLDFWAPWCSPCKQLSKQLRKLANEYPSVVFLSANVDDNAKGSRWALTFDVINLPTVLLIEDFGTPVDYFVKAAIRGNVRVADLKALLNDELFERSITR